MNKKNIASKFGIFAALCITFAAFTGCAELSALSPFKKVAGQVIPAHSETNAVVTTNELAAVVDARVPGGIIPAHVQVETNYVVINVPAQQLPDVWVKDAVINGAIDTGVNLIPGWGQVASLGWSAISAITLFFLNRRNKQNAGVAVSTAQALDGFMSGLNQAGPQGVMLSDKLKKLLEKAHLEAGVQNRIAEILDKHTGYTDEALQIAAVLTPSVLGVASDVMRPAAPAAPKVAA